ncbi:4-oxalomesaconate tautomerase [Brevibacterium sanguinis]|uniref:4-oxalomesaconate tautomerase n=2 Tax=Brevibacterium TaxID=1696 RepID=A0A366IK06_9MICO|nr:MULTISPECIES: 4-oxalomesaconate tautomerase [Brevibacterium]RBP65621.1 4-oxalomesaconate tautomerase [Brevibacterium sanguinis]RBP72255.1 4-oxalomesaconate tautomerase [Brevibacterium celere]
MTGPADPAIDGLPCMLMRGGTSKGAYFLAEDLPPDRESVADLMLRVMGSPDARQIDGLGGAHPLTSKVAIVSRSQEPGVDVDYRFLQVGVDTSVVADAQTCGNLLAGVGPFAVERGLVDCGEERTSVVIRLVNTGDTATATFPTRGGRVVYDGEQSIDGVPGTAAPVEIEMGGDPAPLLPTGHAVDVIEDHRATLVDCGMPVVMLDAAEFGLTGDEEPAELEANTELSARIEAIRLHAGPLMGLGDVAAETVPKMILVSPPRHGGAVAVRAFIPHRVHSSIGVLMAASVAAGVRIPSAVGSSFAEVSADRRVPLEHPSGVFEALVEVEERPGVGFVASYSANLRTARKIFDGLVFPRPRR